MRKILAALVFIGFYWVFPVSAQGLLVPVVAACGTPPSTYVAGSLHSLTMDTTGTLCTAGGGGGSSSVTVTAPLGGLNQTDASGVRVSLSGTVYTGFTTPCAGAVGDAGFFSCLLNIAQNAPNLNITGPATAGWTGETTGATMAATPEAGDVNLLNIATGATTTRELTADPCFNNFANVVSAGINLTGSGVIVNHSSTKKTYICHIHFTISGNENIALVEGTGSTCATNIFGLAGGTTAGTGWNLTSNGIALGNGGAHLFSGDKAGDTHAAGADICLIVSNASQISGTITVIQQ